MKVISFILLITGAFAEHEFLDQLSEIGDLIASRGESIFEMHLRDRRDTSQNQTTTLNTTALESQITCVLPPLIQFQNQIKDNKSDFANMTDVGSRYKSHQFYSAISQDSLDNFCKIYIPLHNEIAICENSTLKRFVTDGFAIFDFICLERLQEFKKQLPCLHKTDSEITSKCTPNCSDEQAQVQKFSNFGLGGTTLTGLSNDTAAYEAFSHFCKHLKCLVNCQTPIITAQCGPDAVKLLHDGVRLVFNKLNDLNDATSLGNLWPQYNWLCQGGARFHGCFFRECSRLASQDFNSPKDIGGKLVVKPKKQFKLITYN